MDPKIVAAIDFGTCNTRMAFAYKRFTYARDVDVVIMDKWESAPGAVMAPTTILVDHTGEVAAFGYEAEDKFRALDKAKANSSFLFKNFKMVLHQKEVRLPELLYKEILELQFTFYRNGQYYSPSR